MFIEYRFGRGLCRDIIRQLLGRGLGLPWFPVTAVSFSSIANLRGFCTHICNTTTFLHFHMQCCIHFATLALQLPLTSSQNTLTAFTFDC